MTPPDRPGGTRPNWGWIAPTSAGGAAVVLVTIATAGSQAQASLWQSAAIDIGSSVLLLGLLGLIEPRLRRSYIEAASRRMEASVHDVEERLTSRVVEVEEEVKSARALFEEYMATEDAAVAAAVEHPDFYSLATALAAANRGKAIGPSGVTVPANEGIPGILIRFQYVTPTKSRGKDRLTLAASVLDSAQWNPDVEVVWPDGATSEEVGAALMVALRDGGVKDVEQKVDWAGTLGRLTAALALSMDSKRSTGHLDGALIERGPEGWALTKTGIEHLQYGVIANFKSPGVMSALTPQIQNRSADNERPQDIDQPNWADGDEWSYIITRAQKVLPNLDLPMRYEPPFVPQTLPPSKPGPAVGGFDFGR